MFGYVGRALNLIWKVLAPPTVHLVISDCGALNTMRQDDVIISLVDIVHKAVM